MHAARASATNAGGAGSRATNATAARLKKLEAARLARIKTLGRAVVRTLKHVDAEARELVVHDLRDLADTAADVLATADDAAAKDASASDAGQK